MRKYKSVHVQYDVSRQGSGTANLKECTDRDLPGLPPDQSRLELWHVVEASPHEEHPLAR